jgi:hypothetical protein
MRTCFMGSWLVSFLHAHRAYLCEPLQALTLLHHLAWAAPAAVPTAATPAPPPPPLPPATAAATPAPSAAAAPNGAADRCPAGAGAAASSRLRPYLLSLPGLASGVPTPRVAMLMGRAAVAELQYAPLVQVCLGGASLSYMTNSCDWCW